MLDDVATKVLFEFPGVFWLIVFFDKQCKNNYCSKFILKF